MNHDERSYIDGLFGRMAEVERDGPARDAEAEAHIADHVRRRPSAPYYMAQTILVQERALEAAQARIAELEARAERGGGLLGALFGGGRTGSGQGPGQGQAAPPRHDSAAGMGARPAQARGAGPGFMGGAMQTALGVAGGVVIGSMIAGALTPDAAAAEAGGDPAGDAGGDGGWDDGGGGDFDFGDGF